MTKEELPTLQDLVRGIDTRLLMIRVEEPNRTDCDWFIGLNNRTEEPTINYLKCETEEKSHELIGIILSKYENIKRGEDFGVKGERVYVYIKCI